MKKAFLTLIPQYCFNLPSMVIDDNRLSDSCWNSEMREVELWENERFGGRFFFFVHRFPFFYEFSQAQILLLILHPRLVRAPLSQPPPLLPLFHSLSRLPLLHRQLLLKKDGVSRILRTEREVRGLEGGMDGVLLLAAMQVRSEVQAQVERDQGW